MYMEKSYIYQKMKCNETIGTKKNHILEFKFNLLWI